MGKFEDLTGQKFGRLTVIQRGEDKVFPNGGKETRWICQCDCGSEPKLIYGKYLKNRKTTSCGCYNAELTSERNKIIKKKYNKYDLSGEYGVGWTYNTNEEFYFDLEDYDKIKDYCWMTDSYGYIVDRNNTKMHRIVLGPDAFDNSLIADHVHGKHSRNDNRKGNLRIVNYIQNGENVGLRTNNTSTVTGVSWHSRDNVWEVHITLKRKNIYLGRFDNFEDAVNARKEAERKYFGEFAYDYSQSVEI